MTGEEETKADRKCFKEVGKCPIEPSFLFCSFELWKKEIQQLDIMCKTPEAVL